MLNRNNRLTRQYFDKSRAHSVTLTRDHVLLFLWAWLGIFRCSQERRDWPRRDIRSSNYEGRDHTRVAWVHNQSPKKEQLHYKAPFYSKCVIV